ncbi:MAG: DegV family protein [Eubacteriales bacterium]
MIKIITDSTSYIPQDLLEKYDITVLPLSVNIDGQEYLETDMTNAGFFKMIGEMSELPKSSPPKYESILEAFEKEVSAGKSIIGVFITSVASETIQRANQAKQELLQKYPKANITIIDSMNTGMALGIVAIAAAEAYTKGAWLEDVVEAAHAAVMRNRFLFVPKNLNQLQKSGRIGKARAIIGNAIQLVPLLTSIKGEINPFEMVRTRSKAIDRMLEIMKEDMDKFGVNKVVVSHIDDPEEANILIKKIKDTLDIDADISEIGPVVGAAVGPGTIGLIYNTIDVHPLNE